MLKLRRLLLTTLALALLSSAAPAAEQWTEEEQTSGVKKMEMVRYAFAGQKMKLQLLVAMNPDCSVVEGWAFEIIKQPEHGTAEIVPTSAFPTFPKENPRYKCKNTSTTLKCSRTRRTSATKDQTALPMSRYPRLDTLLRRLIAST